jgi:hypothetical protein
METNREDGAANGTTGLNKSPFCSKLRTKKYYFLNGPAMVEGDLLDASNDCWCKETMQRVGPDGVVVDPEDCQKGRGCYNG